MCMQLDGIISWEKKLASYQIFVSYFHLNLCASQVEVEDNKLTNSIITGAVKWINYWRN